ncbi:polymorphic toxin-type HINT domain-containing protein [Deinococcus aluminii]|uniref:polymorphic toxin-type HINT domain-containing protein n=1 Tax=Deinococcus aluminii TaxID=1656885 RepID=UPI003CD0A362
MNEHWVGAGHLKVGDMIKQADGTTGVVANVVTLQQTREVFNLTVSEAHTFYVGTQGWLVHNAGPCFPLGFKSQGQYQQFSNQLYAGLARAGFKDSEVFFQGSAVAGRSATNGAAFDVGRVSDFDLAVVNPNMLQKLADAGYRVKANGGAVGPLTAEQVEFLGLTRMQQALSSRMGREVNFMVYGSSEVARVKPSMRVLNPKP